MFGHGRWHWYNSRSSDIARFVQGGVVKTFRCGTPSLELPQDILEEIERLGESPEHLKWMARVAREENIDFVRLLVNNLTVTSQLFDKWFPKLKDFERAKRLAAPIPTQGQLTENDLIARRILQPKIASGERVPQRGDFCAAIFTAPLGVLSLVNNGWPSEYRNAVFLTPNELSEWNEQCEQPYDAHWWYCFQDWNVEFDPPSDSFWLDGCDYIIPDAASSAIATWGMSWGSLAGGVTGELWCIENGLERRLGDLAMIDF